MDIDQTNEILNTLSPEGIVWWTRTYGNVVLSTNFRPYSIVLLHMCTQVYSKLPVIWVDHGYNRPATYKYVEKVRELLGLNLKVYVPAFTSAYRDAIFGPIPDLSNEANLKKFTQQVKIEPFNRAMKELSPTIWITGLRKSQSESRAEMQILSKDARYDVLKLNPLFRWDDKDMESYMKLKGLPNEWDYYDPTKVDEKRECGLHSTWSI